MRIPPLEMKSLGRRFWTVAISGLAFLLVLAGAIHAYRNSREHSTPAENSKETAKTPEEPKCPFGYGNGKKPEEKQPEKTSPAKGKCPFGYDKKAPSTDDGDLGSGASVKKPPGTVKIASRAAARAIEHHGAGSDAKQCPFLARKENAGLLQEMQTYSYSSSSASSYSHKRKSKRKHKGKPLSTWSTRESRPKGKNHWSIPQSVKRVYPRHRHSRSHKHHRSHKKKPRSHNRKSTKSPNSKKRDREQYFKSRGFDVDRIKKMGYKLPDKDHLKGDPSKCPFHAGLKS